MVPPMTLPQVNCFGSIVIASPESVRTLKRLISWTEIIPTSTALNMSPYMWND